MSEQPDPQPKGLALGLGDLEDEGGRPAPSPLEEDTTIEREVEE